MIFNLSWRENNIVNPRGGGGGGLVKVNKSKKAQ